MKPAAWFMPQYLFSPRNDTIHKGSLSLLPVDRVPGLIQEFTVTVQHVHQLKLDLMFRNFTKIIGTDPAGIETDVSRHTSLIRSNEIRGNDAATSCPPL